MVKAPENHPASIERRESWDASRPATVYTTPEVLPDGTPCTAATVILRTRGCTWWWKSGCTFCGYFNDVRDDVTSDDLFAQWEEAKRRTKNFEGCDMVKVYTSGTFFEDKEKKIFLDAIQPTSSFHSKKLSAGTLSLEFSSGKEKIITNCGALEKSTGNAAYLRYSAAHSTIILENTNISEIRDNQPHIKYPQMVSFKKQTENRKHVIETSHNGYIKNYKKIIKRKISFQENENYLTGEDSIISSTSKNKEVVFHIRFHILPKINITQTNSRRSIILRTEESQIWLFRANKDLVLEESVYMDKNNVKETKQIVIKGIARNNREKINWRLSKK